MAGFKVITEGQIESTCAIIGYSIQDSGDDGSAFAVVTRVQDNRDCIPYPFCRSNGAKIVQKKNFSFHDGVEYFEFRRRNSRVVGVLNQPQQLSVVAKEALGPSVGDDRLQGANCEVGLPCPIEPTMSIPRDSSG